MSKSISASELRDLIQSGKRVEVIDVRTPAEFREIHLEVARNEPLDRLDPKAIQATRTGPENEPLYVVCRSGSRGKQACEKFVKAGIQNVINIDGGTMACAAADIPVVRGQKTIPLNCQVQIITGLSVLIGTALAYWFHPLWAIVPGIMGAGLVFSGITNTCAMGMVLARMPWNQVRDSRNP
jgi:rhodanese-related sulfurtransferase